MALSDFLEEDDHWSGNAIRGNVRKSFHGLISAGSMPRLVDDLKLTMQKLPGTLNPCL